MFSQKKLDTRLRRLTNHGARILSSNVADDTEIKKSLDESSSFNRSQLIFFLILLAYVFTTAATTTHIQLLLIDTRKITLPVLNAEIPILSFYIVSPLIILLFHINLFINLYLYAREYIPWLEDPENIPSKHKPSLLTTLFFNYSFINSDGKVKYSIYHGLTITLYSLLPLITLLWVTFKFLPYRSEALTVYHESVIVLDVTMSFIFFRIIKRLTQKRLSIIFLINTAILLISSFYFIFILCLYQVNPFPDHRMKDSLLNINLKVANKTIVEKESRDASIIYDISNDSKTSVEALIKLSDKLDLKNRDLSCANFSGSKFINVYLDNANLQGAYLGWTNLQGAHLWGTNLYDAFLKETNLQGAFLLRANLIVADLTGAYLQGASLTKANLTNANLQGAYLDNATLQVADLDNATLEGASLTGARLNCSTIDKKTNLEGIYYDDINKLFEWHEYSKIDNKTAERCKSLDERSKAYLIKNKKNPNLFLDINKKLSCKNASMALNISHRNISVTFDTGTKVSFRDVITKHIQDNCTQFLQYTK